MGHGHHDHSHGAGDGGAARLKLALGITASIMLVEFVGGWWTNSLALIADAGHMLADAGSLLLAVLALAQASKPAGPEHSYGHGRFPVLAAFVNGILLLLVSAWIVLEAIGRMLNPEPVEGLQMAGIALIGLVANILAFGLLHGGHEHDLNRRGALAHVLSDLLGSIAAVIAGLIIWKTGWFQADPILSMLAAVLIVRIGLRITRESAHVLLEGAPKELDLRRIRRDLALSISGVESVHHLHAWSIAPGNTLMTLHVVLRDDASPDQTRSGIQQWLQEKHGVGHTTVQVENQHCEAQETCCQDQRQ